MGSDYKRSCVESSKFIWIVALVLGSVLIVQYFEFPYGDRVLSLLPLGRINFNSSDANGGIGGGKGHGELQSSLTNHSLPSLQTPEEGSVSKQNISLGNMIDINHTDEGDNIVRTVGLVPENAMNASHIAPAPNEDGNASTKNVSLSVVVAPEPVSSMDPTAVSPSASDDRNSSALESGEKATIAPSLDVSSAAPPESVTPRTVNVDVVAPVVAKSPPVPENGTSRNDNNKSLNHSGENATIATSLDVSSAAPPESVPPKTVDVVVGAPVVAEIPPATENVTSRNKNSESLNHSGSPSDEHSSVTNSTPPTEQHHISPENPPLPSVVSISDMNAMLLHSRATSFSKSPLWPSAADQELLEARFQIEHGAVINSHPNLYAPIYRNLTTFVRSYEIMEQKLKVYIYNDGKGPVFDNPRLRGIYASEGWFMKHLEASSQSVTSNPGEAHLFYFPFSSQLLVDYVYVKDSRSFDDIDMFLKNYVETIKAKHPFWNRTDGADHFVVACHDWAPHETRDLMANCIRALCNSDVQEGFKFGKDVSLPETNVQSPKNPMRVTGGKPASKRSILAFFAGNMHGKVRSVLLQHWDNKDPDMKIFGPIRKGYVWHMQNSKYCICAKGYEVNSPRVVEAILYGCVPVIISDNFVPPFFDILNWEAFGVFVLEKDIPNLKNILVSISDRRYAVMHHRVEQVRQHFLWHKVPERYDIFHMILHSVWYNRVFSISPK